MQTKVYNMSGEVVGEIELSEVVFGIAPNDAGACLNNSDRDDLAALIEDLGHTDLLTDDCFLHLGFLLFNRLLVDSCIGNNLPT